MSFKSKHVFRKFQSCPVVRLPLMSQMVRDTQAMYHDERNKTTGLYKFSVVLEIDHVPAVVCDYK